MADFIGSKFRKDIHSLDNLTRPDLNWFLLITDEVIQSLLDDGKQDAVPFVWVVSACWSDEDEDGDGDGDGDGDKDEDEDEDKDDLDMSGHRCYKVAIELLGQFWILLGPQCMGFEQLMPRPADSVSRTMGVDGQLYEDCGKADIRKLLLE